MSPGVFNVTLNREYYRFPLHSVIGDSSGEYRMWWSAHALKLLIAPDSHVDENCVRRDECVTVLSWLCLVGFLSTSSFETK